MYVKIHDYISWQYMNTHLSFCNNYIVFYLDSGEYSYQNDIGMTAPPYSVFSILADKQNIHNKFSFGDMKGVAVACFDFNQYSIKNRQGKFVLHGIFHINDDGNIKLLDIETSYDIVGGWDDIELAWYHYPKHEVYIPTVATMVD